MSLEFNESNFEAEVLNYEGTVLVDMFAEWCEPCQVMSPIIDEIAEENLENVKVGKIDVDENMELAEKYGVVSIPTILIIKKGEVVKTFLGITDKEEIEASLRG